MRLAVILLMILTLMNTIIRSIIDSSAKRRRHTAVGTTGSHILRRVVRDIPTAVGATPTEVGRTTIMPTKITTTTKPTTTPTISMTSTTTTNPTAPSSLITLIYPSVWQNCSFSGTLQLDPGVSEQRKQGRDPDLKSENTKRQAFPPR